MIPCSIRSACRRRGCRIWRNVSAKYLRIKEALMVALVAREGEDSDEQESSDEEDSGAFRV